MTNPNGSVGKIWKLPESALKKHGVNFRFDENSIKFYSTFIHKREMKTKILLGSYEYRFRCLSLFMTFPN